MKIKKILSVLLAMCLAFSLLAGCSSNEQPNVEVNESAEVEKVLSEYCDGVFDKILDEDALIKQYAGDSMEAMPENIATIFESKAREFCSKAFAEFKYDISDIVVDGDTATANLTVTIPNIDNVDMDLDNLDPMELLTAEEIAQIQTIDPNDTAAQAKFIENLIGRLFDKMLEQIETTQETNPVTLTKGDSGWSVDESTIELNDYTF